MVGLQEEVITPEVFAGKRINEIEALPVFCGNWKAESGNFFDVFGSVVKALVDLKIVIDGDASRNKRIGQEMSAGSIVIHGSVDMYVGARMKGAG